MHYNCLIVDDEMPLAESTSEYFNMFGVSAAYVCSAEACMDFLDGNTVDMFLLDINLKGDSGFTLCRTLRKKYDWPILFTSARTSDDDILIALNIGGDDYIKKPYSLSVLLAKTKVYLKRFSTADKTRDAYTCGDFALDFVSGHLTAFGCEVPLNPMEYKLLSYLVRNQGRIIDKNELFEKVWEDKMTGDGTLNVHIRRLREKIEKNPEAPAHIKTIWGRGYLFKP